MRPEDVEAYVARNSNRMITKETLEEGAAMAEQGPIEITPEQAAHLQKTQRTIAYMVDKKYRAGAKEHGGNLWDLPVDILLDNAIDEAVDQLAYLLTIRGKLTGR